ncbi:DUF4157 domain-containing protein [Geodermatophilus ruber]|uniref:eCIS core domain-containing protein n=1 Tax=Geodermatophilus ruber TaxID=504800 RepID=A0A1I4BIZ3_9ACTN|nr:DUF4157 domain-containing protein [Geodermatophilus ruber]SFK68330.1 protein of unknown function [Geodermatophilus ruber]
MHDHDFDQQSSPGLRPKGARIAEPDDARMLRAAVSGRLDVAGPAGLLGVQRAAGNSGATALVADRDEEHESPVQDVVRSAGAPLPDDVRTDMEGRLGHDFGDVRIHTDRAAEASAQAVNAHAYTVGSHISFQRSAYDPSSDSGRLTLAHELTHVVQQRNGPVDGTEAPGGIRVSHPSDRFEREAAATAAQAVAAPVAASPAPAQVQREAAADEPEEETPVQGSFVQRQEEEAEEEPAG